MMNTSNGHDANRMSHPARSGAALLAELREVRERATAALIEERQIAIARVDEIDAMLAEAGGEGASVAPRRRGIARVPCGDKKRIIEHLRANPGSPVRALADAYGGTRNAGTVAVSNLVRAGVVRHEGRPRQYRFYLADQPA